MGEMHQEEGRWTRRGKGGGGEREGGGGLGLAAA